MKCSVCGGSLVHLGDLGNLVWYRCRNCGMDQYREPKRRKVRRLKKKGK